MPATPTLPTADQLRDHLAAVHLELLRLGRMRDHLRAVLDELYTPVAAVEDPRIAQLLADAHASAA